MITSTSLFMSHTLSLGSTRPVGCVVRCTDAGVARQTQVPFLLCYSVKSAFVESVADHTKRHTDPSVELAQPRQGSWCN